MRTPRPLLASGRGGIRKGSAMRSGKRRPGDGPRVLVVGGGFAGLSALNVLARSDADVTLVDRNVYSTFQPLLYQVATAGLTASDVAYPLWSVTRKTRAHFRQGELARLDLAGRTATLTDGAELSYDYLILATGVSANFYGVTGAKEHSLSLYTRRDAIALRNRLLAELERRASRETDPELDITIVGGGATGVELAGTLAELRNIALPAAFPDVDRARFRVRLIETASSLLTPYHERERDYARQQLVNRGVDVFLNTTIKEIAPGKVTLADGSSHRSDVTVWAAGIQAPDAPWNAQLPRAKAGRIDVGPDLRVTGQDNVFATGDVCAADPPQPQLSAPAIQHGKHAGHQVVRLMAGQPTVPFHYHDKGIMATIGRRSAVVELSIGIRLRGTIAWLAWLGLHLFYLLGGRNRVVTLVNLSWRYLSWSRGGGMIVGDDQLDDHSPADRAGQAADQRGQG
jgi:NADH:ubiquinone reductase (H+-translocating)